MLSLHSNKEVFGQSVAFPPTVWLGLMTQEMEQMLLLFWFFMASFHFSSLVILLRMPSRYKSLSN